MTEGECFGEKGVSVVSDTGMPIVAVRRCAIAAVVFVLEIVWEKPPSECAGEIDLVLRNSPPTSHATPQPSAWIPRESSTNDDIAGPTDSAMVWRLRLTTPRNRHMFYLSDAPPRAGSAISGQKTGEADYSESRMLSAP